jgi:hypothetical protein
MAYTGAGFDEWNSYPPELPLDAHAHRWKVNGTYSRNCSLRPVEDWRYLDEPIGGNTPLVR